MHNTSIRKFLIPISLLSVLLLGAYFRFIGIDWDKNYHLHPDERFLTMIETSIKMEDSLIDYFNTEKSTLNPHNVLDTNGNQTFPFFVYGTFPLFLLRFTGELFNQVSYSEIHLIGRYLSGIFDLGTILLIYLIGKKLFNSPLVGILSAAFYSFAALPIQISHYFIVDNFTTFFMTAAFYMAVRVLYFEKEVPQKSETDGSGWKYLLKNWKGSGNYFFFALALGLAAASKLNAVVAALLLPSAVLLSLPKDGFDIHSKRLQIQIRNVILAGVLSFIFFRIFQPYAFTGPSFFNFSINQEWLNDINELRALSSGLSNYPPSLQWTRRSILFPLKNMILWGMGLAFGIISFLSLAAMGWQLIKGRRDSFHLLLLWNILYITWQAMRWNPTMRYFLLAYPTMAVSAGWLLGKAPDVFPSFKQTNKIKQILRVTTISLVMFLSLGWGIAFINIYEQPMTRIAASEYIYKNIEGPINLLIEGEDSEFSQPLPYRKVFTLNPSEEIGFDFILQEPFSADQLIFDHVLPYEKVEAQDLQIIVEVEGTDGPIVEQNLILPKSTAVTDQLGAELIVDLPLPILFDSDVHYTLILRSRSSNTSIDFFGTLQLHNSQNQPPISKTFLTFSQRLEGNGEYRISFNPFETGSLNGLTLFRARSLELNTLNLPMSVEIINHESGQTIAQGRFILKGQNFLDHRGARIAIRFDNAATVSADETYDLVIKNEDGELPIFIYGSRSAKETDWDDTLPLYMFGMNPFDQYSGIYQSDLNFQMYWDDNADKYERILSILDQTDYIILSSNRQWGSITQAQEKYPLSTALYQGLLDCGTKDVQSCYIDADPTDQSGPLRFGLINTFHVQPEIFGLKFNTQNAEEAFSVYDHPKVFIFKKSSDFSFTKAKAYLDQVDLEKVLNLSPEEIEKRPGMLMLTAQRWREQSETGTWSELFNSSSPINQYQILSGVIWYFFISFIGWMTYPLTRIVFRGFKTKGWGFSRLFGLILLSYFVWIGGSNGVSVTRVFICLGMLCLAIVNTLIFIRNKKEIIDEVKAEIKTILLTELIFLGFFLIFLAIRLGNPDLWHPYKGGEKPMDFSYFNALIKSDTFPPYDPWYAGGYINYYYWGFLLAAIPTKLLGILPSVAYNLVLPMFFAMTGVGAFIIGSNLSKKSGSKFFIAGFISSLFILVIGNLGTVIMIFNGFLRLGELQPSLLSEGFLSKLPTFLAGTIEYVMQGHFNYYPGDWYWIPSRAIPGEPITEFPFFTFLYGDPHAHLFAYPITLMSFGWSLSMITNRWRFRNVFALWTVLISGALITGALRPTNTWDFPVFLLIGIFSIIFSYLKYGKIKSKILENLPPRTRKIVFTVLFTGIFISVAWFLFSPYSRWYGQAYTSVSIWDGSKTPIGAYLKHWGIFLFIICSWLTHEVIKWMKSTPLSRVNEWRKNYGTFIFFGSLLVFFWGYLLTNGIVVSLIIIPILLTSFFLSFQKEISDQKRVAFLLVCLGTALTLVVEMIVLSGDIGRMNTVFKFYLQTWTFLALGASCSLTAMKGRTTKKCNGRWKNTWRVITLILIISGLLYPILATTDKVTDRIAEEVPLTMDGMDYMQYAKYPEGDTLMDLSQDHQLIRWMQENISGTPRIIEANVPEYRWGSRISIYTGLPGVIGWNWHQRQQRAINPAEWVFSRVDDVEAFYSTSDLMVAERLIQKYEIDYVVIGQLERSIYPKAGIEKFAGPNDNIFTIVYKEDDTMLLEVK